MPTKTFTGDLHYVTTKREWNGMTEAYQLSEVEDCHAEALELDVTHTARLAAKAQCRSLIAALEAYRPGRVVAMYTWIDGAWGDYWFVTLDGQEVGEIWFDSFGPVVKGDELGTLAYRAERALELTGKR